MLAALSVVAVLIGGTMFAAAPSTDEAIAKATQDQAKVEYVAQVPGHDEPHL
jgi:type II secretory pathway pseudopilin PulG